MFKIEFVGFRSPTEFPMQVADGYNAHDYLPSFDEQKFQSKRQAETWMMANHKGPDADGVCAMFMVVED